MEQDGGLCSKHDTGRNPCDVLVGIRQERDCLEDQGVNWRIILKKVLLNRLAGCVLDTSGSGQGPVVDCSEHRNEPAVSKKERKC
jgi:hypothetical protein